MSSHPKHLDYQLLDFGDGRKLERFGEFIFDRPCPQAEPFSLNEPSLWENAFARFERIEGNLPGSWTMKQAPDFSSTIGYGSLQFELRIAATGQLGLFPEQEKNWNWLTQACRTLEKEALQNSTPVAPKVLNLFAYTGGSTLAAALGKSEVVHVDSAKPVVQWARVNATKSRLGEAPIRWITDDVRKFVQRELKRRQVYQGIVLDPPSYGHGKKGEAWQIDRHLTDLLSNCVQLLDPTNGFILLTCHSPGWDRTRLEGSLQDAWRTHRALKATDSRTRQKTLNLCDRKNRKLSFGQSVCLTFGPALHGGPNV